MKNLKFQPLIAIVVALLALTACKDEVEDICTPDPNLEGANSSITTNTDSSTYYVHTDIVINASQAEVWSVLTNWQNMGNWSTSFIGLAGNVQPGGQVNALYLFNGDTLAFPHTLHYLEGMEFGWSDPIAFAPEITDNHLFKLEAISDCQTRFIQTDEFTGENPNYPLPALAGQSEAGYNQFNVELKAEAEK